MAQNSQHPYQDDLPNTSLSQPQLCFRFLQPQLEQITVHPSVLPLAQAPIASTEVCPGPTSAQATLQLCTDLYDQLNLLAHAQLMEVDIGSKCGGHGVCGGDRVKAQANYDLSPHTDAEKRLLTPEELANGVRLACQCYLAVASPKQRSHFFEVLTPGLPRPQS